jgi:hypothetical protein
LAHPRPLRQRLQSTAATHAGARDSLKALYTFRTHGAVLCSQVDLRSDIQYHEATVTLFHALGRKHVCLSRTISVIMVD